jgi:DNA repair exonuclease SbcCD ATPase subunit
LKYLAQQNEPNAVSPPPINIPKTHIPSPQTTAHSPQLLRQLETDLENAKQENRQLVAKIQNMERTYQDLSNKMTLVDVELTKSKAREIDAEQLENELRQENNKLEVQLNAKDSEISKLTKEFNMRIQVMESQTQNMEFNTKQKLEEYNSLVNAYDVLENVVKDKDKELEILKNNQKSLEQKLKEKANASNQVTELEMQLQQSQLRENEISQKLEAKEIEFEALRNQFLMFQQEANNQTNTALNSQKQEFSEIESGLIQRIASLEKQLAEKTKKVEEQEHDNDDMMDIIMKLEEKLARLQSGAPLEDENA